MVYRQYEADERYLNEMYAPDEDDFLMERITEDGTAKGKISRDKLRIYLESQVGTLRSIEAERRSFFDEVDNYRRMGASHRQIWGDGDHVSFPNTLGIKANMARTNIENATRLAETQGIHVTHREREVRTTEHDINIVSEEEAR